MHTEILRLGKACSLIVFLACLSPSVGWTAACPERTTEPLAIGASMLCLVMENATPARRQLLHEWVERSARIVAAYYARFPAPLVVLTIGSQSADGVGGGRTTNDAGLEIEVRVGTRTTAADLSKDWVLVHEMIHLALPEIGRRHLWLAEGLAVYVEGVARAQAGNRDIRDVWAESRHAMQKGLPQAGEGGMDQTSTWGRTYWGGALFCLQADVAIRQKTGNSQGLQTALRAILRTTGGYGFKRSIEETLRIGDAATGTQVLEELYQRLKAQPDTIDLVDLWHRLGIPEDPLTQPFDDQAPLAAIRTKITMPMP